MVLRFYGGQFLPFEVLMYLHGFESILRILERAYKAHISEYTELIS